MNIRRLPHLSPPADDQPRSRRSKSEVAASVIFLGVGILCIAVPLVYIFVLLPMFLTFAAIFHHDPWPDQLPVLLALLLLLVSGFGLLQFRRWAAVLVSGLGWAWLVYLCYVKAATVGPTPFFNTGVPVITAVLIGLPLVATLLLTAAMVVYWPRFEDWL
jgi:hypothetical protein